MKVSIYSPYVFVNDDGTIDVDFADVYSHTHDKETGEDEFNTDATEAHDKLIDTILGFPDQLSTADRLRRLADYVEAHPPTTQSG